MLLYKCGKLWQFKLLHFPHVNYEKENLSTNQK